MGALFRASKENKKQVSNTVDDLSLSKVLSAQRRSSMLYFSHVTIYPYTFQCQKAKVSLGDITMMWY